MNLKEIQEWIATAKRVDCISDDYDENGNRWETVIYQRGEGFFRISFCNNHPCSKSSRTVYEPVPVHRNAWMEYKYEWVPNETTI